MDILDPKINDYLDQTLAVEHPVLREMGEYGSARGFPIIGAQSGRLLHLLARALNAKHVLELGSGYGYSAMWFALAMGEGGRVVMTEGAQENIDRAKEYFARAGLLDRIETHVGDALEIARGLNGLFDVVLCDINKDEYPAALPVVRERLRVGGFFICDNMLWSGRVATDNDEASTRGIRELTRQLMAARDFVTTIVPVRDGVSISLRVA
jgi:predicted O-methyltransferase YrrM